MSFSSDNSPRSRSCSAMRFPIATRARLKSFMASMAASIQATDLRLNSTCSRTCQSSTRATRRFHACTSEFATPPVRGFTVPMAATLPSAASRACASGIRSGKAISTPPAAVSGLRARTRSRTSCSIAISSALSTGCPPGRTLGCSPGGTPRGGDQRAQPPARREIADHGGAHRLGCRHHIPQHAVDHVLLKNPQIAVLEQVHLVRFQLQAQLVGNVAQHQLAEIRQPGFGSHATELWLYDLNFVIAKLVGPGLDPGQCGIEAATCVFVGVGAFHAKAFESRSRNRPTSATMPTAWPVPRSLTLVATAGLMSTHTILTQLGSILPVAMECSIEPRQSTSPAPSNCAA